ncbi:MAG: hypothetical protein ACQER9_04110 [Nanobdellota archaeon]
MSEEIQRWVNFMKQNPKTWKKYHTKFINSQFKKQKEFMERLIKTPKGEEKLKKIYNIKNLKGYPKLLRK